MNTFPSPFWHHDSGQIRTIRPLKEHQLGDLSLNFLFVLCWLRWPAPEIVIRIPAIHKYLLSVFVFVFAQTELFLPRALMLLFVQVGKDSLRCSQKFSWFSTQQLLFSYSRPPSSPPPVCLSASSSKFNIHDEATIVGNCNERFEEEHAGRKMVIGD